MKELIKLIGTTGHVKSGPFWVAVEVVNVKNVYGTDKVEVRQLAPSLLNEFRLGQAWVNLESFKKEGK
jgi:hypothetical protein